MGIGMPLFYWPYVGSVRQEIIVMIIINSPMVKPFG